MRNTHTNGPWQTFESCSETFIISAGDPATADTVAKVWHAKYHPTRAQLIAAAPELLATLIELEKLFAPLVCGPNGECPGLTRGEMAIIAARSAITKAGV